MGDTTTIEFDVEITDGDLLDYKLHHKYHAFSGICELVLGVIMLALGVYSVLHLDRMNLTFALLALLFGVVFLVGMPVQLYLHSKAAVKKEGFLSHLHYTMGKNGIVIDGGSGKNVSIQWCDVWKVSSSRKSIFLYFTPTRANVLPKAQLGENLEGVQKVIAKYMESHRVSL
jgi:hypothetical protein